MDKKTDNMMDIGLHDLKSISIGFNESDFLLLLNHSNLDCEDGYAVTIPIGAMKQIVDGFTECGKEYQNKFKKDIGF